MVGLLDFLGIGGGQQPMQAQMPQQAQPQQGFMQKLLDPSIALPLAGALMQPGDFGSNLGQGFALAGQGVATRKKLQQEQAQQNATAKWLESQGADAGLVELAKSGGGREALNMFTSMKKAALDPLDELRAKKLGLEIDQMQNPQAQESDTQRRAREAQQFGLTQDDPAFKSYVLTGRMPREDQAPLTATDKKAILEADEQVQANENVVRALGSVLQGNPGETLNDRAGYGSSASTQSFLARNDPTGFFNDEKGQATTELNNIILNQALSSMKSIFGGNPTEGERAVLLDLQASVDKTPVERKAIIERAQALAARRLEFNKQRAAELRGGTFYKSGPTGQQQQPAIQAPQTPAQGNATSTGVQWRVK